MVLGIALSAPEPGRAQTPPHEGSADASPDTSPDASPEALTLAHCVAQALQHSPATAVEQARLQQANAEYDATRAGLLPKLSGTASYNRLDPDRLNPAGFVGASGAPAPTLFVEESYAGLRLRQLVIDGSTWPALVAAGDGVEAQRMNMLATRADTIFAVTVAFTRLVEAADLVTVAGEALNRQLAFETLTLAFYDAGKVSNLDKLKAESQRMEAERALHNARAAEHLAQAVLRRTMGVEMDRPIRAIVQADSPPTAATGDTPPSEDATVTLALADNPQVKRLTAQVRQADGAVWAAWGEHLPELSVQATYGYRARDVGGEAGEYTASALLEVPIFSGLANDAGVRRAEARKREISGLRQAVENQVRVDVREALTSWRVATESRRVAQKSVEVNREALAAASSMYEFGKATALDVLTSQTDLSRAEAALVQANRDLAIARASLAHITGSSVAANAESDQ
jgi:outer membrane protein